MSAEKALERVPEVIQQVMEHVRDDEPHQPGALNDSMSLRSMLIQLGAAGRALTYDHDALGLRAILYGMAEIAVGWACDITRETVSVNFYYEIRKEAERAHAKHGAKSLLGDDSTTLERFAALAEECGEAADLQAQDARLKELIQVASVCVSWIAWLDVQEEVPDNSVVEAEIHGSCPCCPEFHPAGTDRALVMAQNLAREVIVTGKRFGHYEVKVYADPAVHARPDPGMQGVPYSVRYTWAWFPPEGGSEAVAAWNTATLAEPGTDLGGQGTTGQARVRETYGAQPEADAAAITDGVINAGQAPDRMLPPAENVTGRSLREAVGIAIGAASMTWGTPRKKAVFQEQVANQIATELLGVIKAYAGGKLDRHVKEAHIPPVVYAVIRMGVFGTHSIESIHADENAALRAAAGSSYLVMQEFEVQP